MKILFLNPPRFNELVGKNPSIIEQNRGYNPPLGLLSLATSVKMNTGEAHHVEVLDCQPTQMSYDQITDYFSQHHFDLVGITTMTFTLIDVIHTIKIIKDKSPDCIIVLGGPHVHIYQEETLDLNGVDYLIQGEGEFAILEILRALQGEIPLSSVSGLAYKENGRTINNGISAKISNLDDIYFPDRRFLPVNHYGSLLAKENLITTMFSSRGCPFKCSFCDRPNSPVNYGFRWRSAKNVVDEMEDCYSLGIKEILFYDDTFTVRKSRVLEICDEILTRGLKITWEVRAHVSTMNDEMLKMMKRAGCLRIHYGVECGNDRMLKVINKSTTIKKVKEVFRETKHRGIETLAYFMIGQHTETLSDIGDTMRLSRELKPDFCHFTIFCPYPGTRMYKLGLEKGIIKNDVWREFAKNPGSDFQIPVWEENFSRAELYELIVKCYKSFYLRPGYAIKKLFAIASIGELKRKLKAALSVTKMKAKEVDKLDLEKATKVK
ncbi:MAG: hypothetical protein AMK70_02605 [Nitrospira bacterium SG8_35_1]|nr:MAG: hypothetical protein AMK70_02605 [Nitrospira bacterium SG8_35_1]